MSERLSGESVSREARDVEQQDTDVDAAPVPTSPDKGWLDACYCGYLEWTVKTYGRLAHKHGCPARTEPYCQSHPDGCPA